MTNTSQATLSQVSYYQVSQKTSKSKCNQIISSTTKRGKQYYFHMLGYSTIFLGRTLIVNDIHKITRHSEMIEEYEKLRCQSLAVTKHTLGSRLASFQDVWGKDYAWYNLQRLL